MSERSIAEIVRGVTVHPCVNRRVVPLSDIGKSCEEMNCREWRASDGEVYWSASDIPEPSVDDLIAWLRAEVRNGHRFMDVSAWRSSTAVPNDMCSVSMVRDERYDISFHGKTLLAALEAAVRQVSA